MRTRIGLLSAIGFFACLRRRRQRDHLTARINFPLQRKLVKPSKPRGPWAFARTGRLVR